MRRKNSWRIAIILAEAREKGWEYHLGVLEFLHSVPDCELAHPGRPAVSWDELSALKFDGAIVSLGEPEDVAAVQDLKVPVVDVSANQELPKVPRDLFRVCPDNREAGRLAAEYFLKRGYVRFAFAGNPTYRYTDERLRGFQDRLKVDGHDCPVILFSDAEINEKRMEGPLRSLEPGTALLADSDGLALRLLPSLAKLGLKVPEQVAVLGIGNREEVVWMSSISLSSVMQNRREVGRRAAEELRRVLRGGAIPKQPILISPAGVIGRKSTDTLPVDDQLVREALRVLHRVSEEPWDTLRLCRFLGVSRRKLERRFMQVLGCSPYQVILNARIDRAAELLQAGHQPIKDIARQCGFSDTSMLYDHFQSRVGCTPYRYRQRHLKSGRNK